MDIAGLSLWKITLVQLVYYYNYDSIEKLHISHNSDWAYTIKLANKKSKDNAKSS